MARPARVSPARILAAAAAEFAERGYSGARVDQIAHRAGVNKAMIYYHFRNKQELYRTLLRQTFTRAGERLQAIAALDLSPVDQVDLAISSLAAFVEENAFFPGIMLREIAEGGVHLDRRTMAALATVPEAFSEIVEHGVALKQFRPVHPFAAYLSTLAPLVLYHASTPIRRELASGPLPATSTLQSDAFVQHLQQTARHALARPQP